MLPISADTSFDYPGGEFYTQIERHGLPPALGPEEGPELKKAYGRLMRVIAKPVSPHASMRLIEAQVGEMVKRLRGPRATTRSMGSSSLSLGSHSKSVGGSKLSSDRPGSGEVDVP